MSSGLARWRRRLYAVEDALLALLLVLLLLLAVAQIGLRVFADTGFVWAEPVSRLMVMWLALLGALAATRERRHIAIDALPRLLPPRGRRVAWAVSQASAAAACGLLAWLAADLLLLEWEAPGLLPGGIPGWAGMLVMPPAFALMALRFLLAAVEPPPPLEAAAAP